MNQPTLIYCADGNKRFADIAVKHGFCYGAQLPNTIYHAPYFCDQDWRNPDRAKYMAALKEHRPALATVLDYERGEQLDAVMSWAYEAAQHVTEAVIIIPKAMSTIDLLPTQVRGKEVRLGYSVPTGFAGTCVPTWEFGRRPIHLLGGSPTRQMELARYLNVKSADGNYVQKMALRYGQYFTPSSNGKTRGWPKLYEVGLHVDTDVPYVAFELSCINLRAAWRGVTVGIRFASEVDIPAIKAIANQYKHQLGFVNRAALQTALKRRELWVAQRDGLIVAFVHWHARRDGWNTVYEIATHRDWRNRGVGRALLDSLPRPLRLKCTVDNTAALDFYGRVGMQIVRTEDGKKRKLHVLEAA